MDIDTAVETIARWLDAVDVATAWPRVEKLQAMSYAKDVASWGSNSARHEAAHAVVAHRGGLHIGYARIRPDGSGAVAYEADPGSVTETIGRTAADLAGILVELLEDAHPWRRQQLAISNDILLARLNADIVKALAPTWRLSNRFFAIVSCCCVLSHRDEIERTACALSAAGSLDARRIAALCGDGPRAAVS